MQPTRTSRVVAIKADQNALTDEHLQVLQLLLDRKLKDVPRHLRSNEPAVNDIVNGHVHRQFPYARATTVDQAATLAGILRHRGAAVASLMPPTAAKHEWQRDVLLSHFCSNTDPQFNFCMHFLETQVRLREIVKATIIGTHPRLFHKFVKRLWPALLSTFGGPSTDFVPSHLGKATPFQQLYLMACVEASEALKQGNDAPTHIRGDFVDKFYDAYEEYEIFDVSVRGRFKTQMAYDAGVMETIIEKMGRLEDAGFDPANKTEELLFYYADMMAEHTAEYGKAVKDEESAVRDVLAGVGPGGREFNAALRRINERASRLASTKPREANKPGLGYRVEKTTAKPAAKSNRLHVDMHPILQRAQNNPVLDALIQPMMGVSYVAGTSIMQVDFREFDKLDLGRLSVRNMDFGYVETVDYERVFDYNYYRQGRRYGHGRPWVTDI